MINKEQFGHELKAVIQIKKELEELVEKEKQHISAIKEIEVNLYNVRIKIQKYERMIINKCDKIFYDIYNQLPSK